MSECTTRRQPEAMANYKCLFFLDVGHDDLRPSEISNQSHMVSYCSAIKLYVIKNSMNNIIEKIGLTVKLLKILDIYFFCDFATNENIAITRLFIICNGAPNYVSSFS